jgi:hypothetical protein
MILYRVSFQKGNTEDQALEIPPLQALDTEPFNSTRRL